MGAGNKSAFVNEQDAIDQQNAVMALLREEYENNLSTEMGKLHNQFVAFIETAQIPLTHVLLVLDLLRQETLEQAHKTYLG